MSLNKLSNDTIKGYLSLGCNKINCNELKVGGVPYTPPSPPPVLPVIITGVYTPITLDFGVLVESTTSVNFRFTYIDGICIIACQLNFDTGSNNIGTSLQLNFSVPNGMSIIPGTGINNNGYISTNGSPTKPLYITNSPSVIALGGNNVIQTLFQTTNTSVAQINGVVNISLNVMFSAELI